ncbi:MAG: glycosyltransferase, partial [Microbacterium sp.]|nr:glycosyltransferase [Microbacterium sp.]
MSAAPKLLIVVPAWNEDQSVGAVVRDVFRAAPGADCVVVDDGSSDRTAEIARAAGARVIALPFNLGVGGAMRAGFRYARDHAYDVVVQVDGDGQHDPRDVAVLLASLGDTDIVIGARFAGVGEYDARGPRRWAMRVLAGVVSPDGGELLVDGRPAEIGSPRQAADLGFAFIHQELALVPEFSAIDNMTIGVRPSTFLGLGDARRHKAIAREVA